MKLYLAFETLLNLALFLAAFYFRPYLGTRAANWPFELARGLTLAVYGWMTVWGAYYLFRMPGGN